MMTEQQVADHFAGRFEIVGECWEFTGYREGGYGRVRVGSRLVLVHRLALGMTLGRAVPADLKALHRCDNPPCLRPSHLYEGTMADNARDRDAAGHTAVGARAGKAKLSEAQVLALREAHAVGLSLSRLGQQFGVSKESARRIVLRQVWRSI